MSRDSFVVFASYMKSFSKLNMEQRGLLITAMMNYQMGQELPEMDALTDMAFSFIKDDMDFNNQKYDEMCERNKNNGKKGGRPKASGFSENPKNPDGFSENPQKPTKTLYEYESDYESESESKDNMSDQVSEIVDYLNAKLGTRYKKSKSTTSQIKARLEEGHTVDDFKTVIDKKVRSWKDDPKMSQYLRPETLFRPSHFESYLNEIETGRASPKEMTPSTHSKIHNFGTERNIDYEALGAEFANL